MPLSISRSRNSRRRANQGRVASGSSLHGGSSIRPGELDMRGCRRRRARCPPLHPAARRTLSPRPRNPPAPGPRGVRWRRASRLRHRRAAAADRRESTDWMHANGQAAFFALLDCRWPMRCHLAGISAVSAIFCRPSCTLFSPNFRCPAAHASRTRSAPNVFETATRVMSRGLRPDRRAAAAMRSCMSARVEGSDIRNR